MLRSGTQRTLAWVSSASATQTRACAAATIRGRASERRRAVARLIGNRRSVDSSGAGLILGLVDRGDAAGAVAPAPPSPGVTPGADGPSGNAEGKLGAFEVARSPDGGGADGVRIDVGGVW